MNKYMRHLKVGVGLLLFLAVIVIFICFARFRVGAVGTSCLLQHLPRCEFFLLVSNMCLLLAAGMAIWFMRRSHFQNMRAAKQLIRESEMQAQALHEQLIAANQQLTASNQQLDASNQQLRAEEQHLKETNRELANTQKALMESRAHYRHMTINVPGIVYQFKLHPSGSRCFPYVSPKSDFFLKLPPEHIMSDTESVFNMIHPDDRQLLEHSIMQSATTLSAWHWEGRFIIYGCEYYLQCAAQPQRLDDGSILWDGIIIDVSERRRAEDRIRAALREKETMLKEIHHRVKNNLQVISSLLSLQAARIYDPKDLPLFTATQERVRAMALVHEKLYQAHDLAHINFHEYLRSLVTELPQIYSVPNVKLELEASDVFLTIEKAIPCGLITNELLTNALCHAFTGNAPKTPVIKVVFHENERGNCCLTVADNGVGLPPELDISSISSLGLQLVNILTRQIKGQLHWTSTAGASVMVDFPKN